LIGEEVWFDLIGAVMGVREPVAMEIPLEEGAAARVPPRIRRRLLEGRTAGGGGGQTSAEEIEARLKEAEQRRQVGVPVSSLVFPCLLLCLLFPLLLPPHGGLPEP
jgi:hypothetical protein